MQASQKPPIAFGEYIALMALLMSIVALSIDTILPGLYEISSSLGAQEHNQRQLLISTLFLGMAFSQIIYGLASDAFGRKKPIYFGLGVFILGCVISALAQSFWVMLVGRFLQGIGAAGPRIICVAIVRDQSKGREMAKIMSLIMMIFLLVPAIAPAIGQVILHYFHWRVIFWMFVVLATLAWVWLMLRQPETLAIEHRRPIKIRLIAAGLISIITHKTTMVYTLAAGLIFGAFIGFLNTAQQVLQELYQLGDQFAAYFAVLALALGVASYSNSKLVIKFGMRALCRLSLCVLSVISLSFGLFAMHSHPSLIEFMAYLVLSFLFIGLLFSNLNALAMEPQGHQAGLASAFIGSLSLFISLGLGYLIGASYNSTVVPLVAGFALLSVTALILTFWFERAHPDASA